MISAKESLETKFRDHIYKYIQFISIPILLISLPQTWMLFYPQIDLTYDINNNKVSYIIMPTLTNDHSFSN